MPVQDITMWTFIILCLTVSASSTDVFKLCCPKGSSLIRVVDPDGIYSNSFKCYNSTTEEASDNNSALVLVTENVTVKYGIPEECDLQLTWHNENVIQLSDNDNYCYGRLALEETNGTLKQVIPKTVALVCNETSISGVEMKIQKIRKCCPTNQMYDTNFHQCRNVDDDFKVQWFIEQLGEEDGNIFEFETGLYCKTAEYAVELKDDTFSLKLEGSALNISSFYEKGPRLSPMGNWCVDREYSSRRLMARVCTQDCSAFGAYCLKKCCPVGQHYKPFHCGSTRSGCVPNVGSETLFDMSEYMNPLQENYGIGGTIGLGQGLTCSRGKIVLNHTGLDEHILTKKGQLYMTNTFTTNADFCLEMFDWRECGSAPDVTAVPCFIEVAPPVKNFKMSFAFICISCVCLMLTLVVYCTIPELRNLHGWTLICHLSTMLIAFSCLARVQYGYVPNKNNCAALGHGIYFGFVAAFMWLNVMCLDIWWTFGSVRNVQPLHKGRATRRRFFWYSLYAWGVAVSLLVTMLLLDKYPLTKVLDANMGNAMCWFGTEQNTKDDWPHYIFFVIPMGVVTSINFVLWLLTARHCARVKSEVHRLQAGSVGDRAKRRFRLDKANFVLTGKLWVVMGAGWGSELVSTLVEPNTWTHVVDSINELQGVFIFIILIFKPKLYYLIRKKLGLEKPNAQKNGQSSTARTSSTFISRTISTDERALRISVPNDNAKAL